MNDSTVNGLFNELEKIGVSVSELLLRSGSGVAGKVIEHPLAVVWRAKQQKKGLSRHQKTMMALRHGYPAGWEALGIRPR